MRDHMRKRYLYGDGKAAESKERIQYLSCAITASERIPFRHKVRFFPSKPCFLSLSTQMMQPSHTSCLLTRLLSTSTLKHILSLTNASRTEDHPKDGLSRKVLTFLILVHRHLERGTLKTKNETSDYQLPALEGHLRT